MKIITCISTIIFTLSTIIQAYIPPENKDECACLEQNILSDLVSDNHEDNIYACRQIIAYKDLLNFEKSKYELLRFMISAEDERERILAIIAFSSIATDRDLVILEQQMEVENSSKVRKILKRILACQNRQANRG